MFLLLPMLISLGVSIYGQSKTGTIRGVLTDSQGAVMPGRKLSIDKTTSAEGEKAKYVVTDANGAFQFSELPFDTYLLEFTMPGFEAGFKKQVSITADHPVAGNVAFVMEPCGDVDPNQLASVTDKEMGEIVRQMLVAYLPKGLDDTKPALSSENIKPEWVGEFTAQFTLMTQAEIDRRSQSSEFSYLKIAGLKTKEGCVAANFADLVALPRNRILMSGGVKTYEFRKIGNHWLGKIVTSVVF